MGSNKYKILVVEDDRSICGFLETMLESYGYSVVTAQRCGEGMSLFSSHNPDLVVLDLGLPDMDGEAFIRYVRQGSGTPILVLSARTEETDKVSALDLGANDYITKPFGTAELLARVRAALRTNRSMESGGVSVFRMDDLTIDFDRRHVTLGDETVKLTQTEYNILALMACRTGKVLTYANIISEIWGEKADSSSIKKLQVNMANIRKKLGSKPGDNRYIINALGVGYRMRD